MPGRLRSHSTVLCVFNSTVIAGIPMDASHPSASPVTSYESNELTGAYPDACAYALKRASVSGRMPCVHSDSYTAFAALCQKITASGSLARTKSRMAAVSGSENGFAPALTFFACHTPSGFHLQSKLRLRSTSRLLKRPDARIVLLTDTSLAAKRPSFPTTAYTPSGFAEGMTETVRLAGTMPGFASRYSMNWYARSTLFQSYPPCTPPTKRRRVVPVP